MPLNDQLGNLNVGLEQQVMVEPYDFRFLKGILTPNVVLSNPTAWIPPPGRQAKQDLCTYTVFTGPQ